MALNFDICGTHIPIASIKEFKIIDVEFIFRPVYHEAKKTVMNALAGKRYEFYSMQPYAAIIGQQGHKSALGEYERKKYKEAENAEFKEAVIYTIADKLKLKAFKHPKFHCMNLAGRLFSTYLDDIPVMIVWDDGRIAEVTKEDSLYATLGECTIPGIQYIPSLIIKADKTYCFYGKGIQIEDASLEYTRLKKEIDTYFLNERGIVAQDNVRKKMLPQMPQIKRPLRLGANKEAEPEVVVSDEDN